MHAHHLSWYWHRQVVLEIQILWIWKHPAQFVYWQLLPFLHLLEYNTIISRVNTILSQYHIKIWNNNFAILCKRRTPAILCCHHYHENYLDKLVITFADWNKQKFSLFRYPGRVWYIPDMIFLGQKHRYFWLFWYFFNIHLTHIFWP